MNLEVRPGESIHPINDARFTTFPHHPHATTNNPTPNTKHNGE